MAKKKEEKPIIEKGYEPIKRAEGGYSYRTQVTLFRHIIRKTFKTFKDAKTWKTKQIAIREENRANGITYKNGMYLEDLCADFVKTRIDARKSTIKAYSSTINTHLKAYGKFCIKDIHRRHALELQAVLKEKGHSPGGINKIINLFKSILDHAVKMEYMEKNPFFGVKNMKVDSNKFDYWSKERAMKFLASVKKHELYYLFAFALNTGLRRGEICGLRWGDIVIESSFGQLTFGEQLTPDMERTGVKGHKSRTISLAPGAIKILKELQLSSPSNGFPAETYVFRTKLGQPVPPNKVTLDFKKAQVAAGFKKTMKFHGCRHTFASFLAKENISEKKIQKLLGHVDAKTTAMYSHLNTKDERETVKIVDFSVE